LRRGQAFRSAAPAKPIDVAFDSQTIRDAETARDNSHAIHDMVGRQIRRALGASEFSALGIAIAASARFFPQR
jgi:hypothetical protein